MKSLAVVLLFLLVGCASRQPLEELVAEAELTGDWSAVEKYRRMNRRMNRIEGDPLCENGFILFCRTLGDRDDCACVKRDKQSIFND